MDKNRNVQTGPSLTIVTATRNCREGFLRTIRSLRDQDYGPFEWVVADGGSEDGTIDLLQDSGDIITFWDSRIDTGVYDAWNRVLAKSSGDWCLFLGAGDTLAEPDSLSRACRIMDTVPDETELVYGDVILTDPRSGEELYRYGGPWGRMEGRWKWGLPMLPMHPGVFHRRRLLRNEPAFDPTFQIAADNLLLLSSLQNHKPTYTGTAIVRMPVDGISARIASTGLIKSEFRRIRKLLGLRQPFGHAVYNTLVMQTKILLHALLPTAVAAQLLDFLQTLRNKPRRFVATVPRKLPR